MAKPANKKKPVSPAVSRRVERLVASVGGAPLQRVYLDSTIPSAYFDQRTETAVFSEITRRWWAEESAKFDVWISPATQAEIEDGNHPYQKSIIEFCASVQMLEVHAAVDSIAEYYMENLAMPKEAFGDAHHLSYASYYRFDFLVTWNCNHLANARKRRHLETLNRRLGLDLPLIVTPSELFEERDEP